MHPFLVAEIIPEEIGNLKKLESLSLQNNRILRLPSSLNKLSALRDINLSRNFVSNFPVQLGGLKHLNSVDFSNNKLTSLPNEISAVEAIEINLNQNQVGFIFLCQLTDNVVTLRRGRTRTRERLLLQNYKC